MMNEEDIQPSNLPEEVIGFLEDSRELIAEQTGISEEQILFDGLTLHFSANGRPLTLEVMAKR